MTSISTWWSTCVFVVVLLLSVHLLCESVLNTSMQFADTVRVRVVPNLYAKINVFLIMLSVSIHIWHVLIGHVVYSTLIWIESRFSPNECYLYSEG